MKPCTTYSGAATTLDSGLVAAYCTTTYTVFTNPEIELKIGERSGALCELFGDQPVGTGTFITAFNPLGAPLSLGENLRANTILQHRLDELDANYIAGEGRGSIGDWPPEPSYLVIGLDRNQAISLGVQFKQNAIVWIGADCIPELTLLE